MNSVFDIAKLYPSAPATVMTLSRRYRIKFTQKSDRLIFFLAMAVALHGGIAAVGLKGWQPQVKHTTSEQQPIEFVYLESVGVDVVSAERHASVSAVAGGEQRSNLPINAGKPGPEASRLTAVDQATKPMPAVAQAPVGAIVPTSNSGSAATKAVDPVADESSAKETSESRIESVEPEQVAIASPPAEVESLLPAPSAIAASPSPLQVSAVPPTTPSDLDPGSQGRGLDGPPNPNRTAAAPGAIDTQEDRIWGPYINQLNREIYENWNPVVVGVTRQTKVRFAIDREGQLVDLRLIESSGSDTADEMAIQAIQSAAPFQPLPPESTEQQLIVNFTFTYQIRSTPLPSP